MVYNLRFSQFDQIRESLSCEFVDNVCTTIQTHNTSTQIAKLIYRKFFPTMRYVALGRKHKIIGYNEVKKQTHYEHSTYIK